MAKSLKSVIAADLEHCLICNRKPVQIHHVFYGTANRKLSDQDGAIVPLCADHHTGAHGVHHDRELDIDLKQLAQRELLKYMSLEDFIARYGKSYI